MPSELEAFLAGSRIPNSQNLLCGSRDADCGLLVDGDAVYGFLVPHHFGREIKRIILNGNLAGNGGGGGGVLLRFLVVGFRGCFVIDCGSDDLCRDRIVRRDRFLDVPNEDARIESAGNEAVSVRSIGKAFYIVRMCAKSKNAGACLCIPKAYSIIVRATNDYCLFVCLFV